MPQSELLRKLQCELCIWVLPCVVAVREGVGCLVDEGFDAPAHFETQFLELDWIKLSNTAFQLREKEVN